MKKGFIIGTVTTLLMLVACTGWAAPITFIDVVDKCPDVLVNTNNPLNYTHTFTDVGPNGNAYNASTDTITDALLQIVLWDDWAQDGLCLAGEKTTIKIDATTVFSKKEVDGGYVFHDTSFVVDLGDKGLLNLLVDGNLGVTIKATTGDFYFDKSTLIVNADRTAPVPEPATLMLLGSGLIGLAGFRKKKQQ